MRKLIAVLVLSMIAFGGCTATQQMKSPKFSIAVTNPISLLRTDETISLDWEKVRKSIPGLTADNVAVLDVKANRMQMTQIFIAKNTSQLLFQVDLAPKETRHFHVMIKPEDLDEPVSPLTTYCRFVPERKDDFAWENDKVCNRMYGPELEYETITCGIDAWGKCVPYPVFDKMIKAFLDKGVAYHENHGEGGDFYKVGNTLGCGAMAPLINDKVCLAPHNYYDWNVITNGPIRSVFELYYRPWKAGPYTVRETKRISIDLGSNMTRFECHYDSADAKNLSLSAGIILRETSEQTWSAANSIAYWLPTDGHDYGNMGCGVLFNDDYQTGRVEADSHLLLTLKHDISNPVVYYAGSCWDKNEEFNTFEKWQTYLKNFKARLDTPIIVKYSK